MACGATLKRTLEFDPFSSQIGSPKRRRCSPTNISPIPQTMMSPSTFGESSSNVLCNDSLKVRLAHEILRMQKQCNQQTNDSSQSNGYSSPSSPSSSESCKFNSNNTSIYNAPNILDIPLFTFRQVSMICDILMKEKEEHLKESFDKIIKSKLTEQYESFLKFDHEKTRSRIDEIAPSYIS